MEEHELGAGEDLIEKVFLVLEDSLYIVGSDRKDGNADYNVFALEDM